MIKCVAFDFDGTLVDSNDLKRETFFKTAHPWDASGEVVAEVFERWPLADRYEKTHKIAEGLINRKLLPEDSSVESWGTRLANDYTAQVESAITNGAEMPGASQALTKLSEMGVLLFVNSATPIRPLQRLLELLHWAHFFRAVYGAEASKADNLRSIAQESDAAMNEIVHVGDQPDDLRGAEQCNCHFVAMAAGNVVPAIRNAPLLVEDLRDLPTLFNRISQETA
jgi:phosphoglycolate phosphatase